MIAHILAALALGFQAEGWSHIFILSPAYGVVVCLYNALFKRDIVEIYVQAATEAAGPGGARRNYYLWVFLCSSGLVLALSSIVFTLRG